MRKREMNIEIPNNKTQIPNKSQFSKFKFNGRCNQSFEFGIYCLEFICFLVHGFCYFHFGAGYAGILVYWSIVIGCSYVTFLLWSIS